MYYSGNRFLTQTEMEVNAQYIYAFLTAEGWTKNAICGMLGNMQSESSINPAIWEGLDDSDPSNGFGLVQWTPSTKYTNWAIANSLIPESMDANLQRILYEVSNGLQWGNDSDGNPPPYSFSEFTHSTEDPYTLAMYFLWHYERPLVKDQPHRGTQAEAWYTFLEGTPSPPTPKKSKIKPYMLIIKRRRFILP